VYIIERKRDIKNSAVRHKKTYFYLDWVIRGLLRASNEEILSVDFIVARGA
jgi:hypothetical protein